MKYSYMSFSTPELDLPGMLEVAGRYGYDGVELRLDSNHAHGVEVGISGQERKNAAEQARTAGIELACLATSLRYADPQQTESIISQTHERIDLAGDMDVPVVRVFGGKIPEGSEREQAADLLVESLTAVADHARDRGVTLCLETHDDWCDPVQVAAVMARVDRASIAANWDIMHPVRTGLASIEESFNALAPWIRHVHFHDGIGLKAKLVPVGTGSIDHKQALKLLLEAGYDGFLSGEWIGWEPYDVHLPRELNTMKRYEQELSSGE